MASVGGGDSDSRSNFSEGVYNHQALQGLYGAGSSLYNNRDNTGVNNAGNQATNYADQIAGGAMGGWNNQMGGGIQNQGLQNSIMQSMQNPSSTGRMYEDIVGGPGNTYIDPMVEANRQSHQENYDRFAKPNTDMAAESAGQSGSARHGVSQFLGQNQTNLNAMRDEMQMRGENYGQDMDWKMQIAQQADLGRGQAQDRGISMLNQQNANQQGALNYGQGMQQIGSGGMDIQNQMGQVPWDQLMQYAQVVGAPTVLGTGSSRSGSVGAEVGVGGGAKG